MRIERDFMNKNKILYKGRLLSIYSQIALIDTEIKDSYPQWKVGKETIVFGTHGVAVVTKPDQMIDAIVFEGADTQDHKYCLSGEVLFGNRGITIGNVANKVDIPISSGKYAIVIYTDEIGEKITELFFSLIFLGRK